jgi:hypothetical protein
MRSNGCGQSQRAARSAIGFFSALFAAFPAIIFARGLRRDAFAEARGYGPAEPNEWPKKWQDECFN